MFEKPMVKEGDWIEVGKPALKTGVVSSIYSTRPNVIEIVHLNTDNRPVYEDVLWSGIAWEFTNTAVSSGFAKLQKRLQPYVAILLAGQFEEASHQESLDSQVED